MLKLNSYTTVLNLSVKTVCIQEYSTLYYSEVMVVIQFHKRGETEMIELVEQAKIKNFSLPNLRIKQKIRLWFAIRKWNRDVPFISNCIRTSTTDDAQFKWVQLVWQEIWMWIALGKQVPQKEFDLICDRRGFDDPMQKYLREMLRHVCMGSKLSETTHND
jgi:hypothetical protein